jgi:hypothetical protein
MPRKKTSPLSERRDRQGPGVIGDRSVSARDRETVRRLVIKKGLDGLAELGKSVVGATEDKRKPGAPRQLRIRQCAFAALYLMANCHKRTNQTVFASKINDTVKIKYGRRLSKDGKVVWKENNSPTAVKQDLHRGLKNYDEKLISEIAQGFMWWRFNSVKPEWGFLIGGGSPNLRIDVIDPNLLIQWIDAAIDCLGGAAIKQRMQNLSAMRSELPNSQTNK